MMISSNGYKQNNDNGNISNNGSLYGFPARVGAKQAAGMLGFQEHDIAVLTSYGLLKPLGKPADNAKKYFATLHIADLTGDVGWLGKATQAISENWKKKNASRVKTERIGEAVLSA